MEGYTNTIRIPMPNCTLEQVQTVCDEINEWQRYWREREEDEMIEMIEAQIDAD